MVGGDRREELDGNGRGMESQQGAGGDVEDRKGDEGMKKTEKKW